MSKSRGPFTLIWLSAPGAKARHIDLPRGITTVFAVASALCLCLCLCMGRKVRAWFDAEELRTLSASMLAAKDRAQSTAEVRGRAAFFQGARPGATYTELANQQLKLYDVNAQRSLVISPFRADGRGDPAAFQALREFMRCRRTGHSMDMNPGLVRLLMRISAHFDGAELQIISAHRLADGVVTNETSQHNLGTASDIRIAGVPVETLAAAAHEEGARGVGIYSKTHFVHVDVREKPYSWRDDGEDDEGIGDDDFPSAEAEVQEETGSFGDDSDTIAPEEEKTPTNVGAVELREETLEGTTLSGL